MIASLLRFQPCMLETEYSPLRRHLLQLHSLIDINWDSLFSAWFIVFPKRLGDVILYRIAWSINGLSNGVLNKNDKRSFSSTIFMVHLCCFDGRSIAFSPFDYPFLCRPVRLHFQDQRFDMHLISALYLVYSLHCIDRQAALITLM